MYKIQLEAPTPKAVLCHNEVDCPIFYGYEYHGIMDHKQSEMILDNTMDGSYLVRKSPGSSDYYTLSVRFDQKTKHYKIYYKQNWGHYLKEDFKRFETIHELVADGLVDFYMRKHAAPIIKEMMTQSRNCYQQSPYMTLNRRKLRALSNDLRKSIKSSLENNSNGFTGEPNIIVNNTMKEINTSNNQQQEELTDDLPVVYEKSHCFKIHTFKGLNWCELCANFLWGFTAQGVKCEGNTIILHISNSNIIYLEIYQ